MNRKERLKPENNGDYGKVAICFQDRTLSYLFAELLEIRGCETEIYQDIDIVPADLRLVTEALFLSRLSDNRLKNSLIVGPACRLREIEASTLSQPLTEEKISDAFNEFLKRH